MAETSNLRQSLSKCKYIFQVNFLNVRKDMTQIQYPNCDLCKNIVHQEHADVTMAVAAMR